jgi:RNA polymerase sigma-70 factor, ECF subfamily
MATPNGAIRENPGANASARSPMAEAGDEALLLAAGQGDRDAFTELVGRHLARAVAIAGRMLASRADAEEVAQEAFLRVWQKAPAWQADGRAKFSTWLHRVIVNLCIDRKRRRPTVPIDAIDEPADDAADGFDRVSQQERRTRVARALAELPDRQRAAVVLSYYEGLSNSAVADALEVSVGAVESLLVRARRSLATALADLGTS